MSTENCPVILYGAGDNGKSALALLRNRYAMSLMYL